jgi:hypothetical protein
VPFCWGGGSFGPRLLCEVLPCLSILQIPVAAGVSLATFDRAVVFFSFVVFGLLG